MYDYYRKTYGKDVGVFRRGAPEVMQKRSNVNLYTRMWGGSAYNMLHPANRSKSGPETWLTTQQLGFAHSNQPASIR